MLRPFVQISTLSNNILFLLYGDKDLPSIVDKHVLEHTLDSIHKTGRFCYQNIVFFLIFTRLLLLVLLQVALFWTFRLTEQNFILIEVIELISFHSKRTQLLMVFIVTALS